MRVVRVLPPAAAPARLPEEFLEIRYRIAIISALVNHMIIEQIYNYLKQCINTLEIDLQEAAKNAGEKPAGKVIEYAVNEAVK